MVYNSLAKVQCSMMTHEWGDCDSVSQWLCVCIIYYDLSISAASNLLSSHIKHLANQCSVPVTPYLFCWLFLVESHLLWALSIEANLRDVGFVVVMLCKKYPHKTFRKGKGLSLFPEEESSHKIFLVFRAKQVLRCFERVLYLGFFLILKYK